MPSSALQTTPAIRERPMAAPTPHGQKRPVFALDLDGTVTACEMLPRIARLAGLEEAVAELTRWTLEGQLAFAPSFRKRFSMLRHLPLAKVHETVDAIPLDPHIESFILRHREDCAIITGNLDLWISPLIKRLGCRCFASRGMITRRGPRLLSVLDKGRAATILAREGRRVIAVGESVGDIPLFAAASVSIAYAGVHRPVPEIRRMARYHAANGEALCALLEEFAWPPAPDADAPERNGAPKNRPGRP